jgi:hypothetical protein
MVFFVCQSIHGVAKRAVQHEMPADASSSSFGMWDRVTKACESPRRASAGNKRRQNASAPPWALPAIKWITLGCMKSGRKISAGEGSD